MRVHVILYSILREKLPRENRGRATLNLPAGSALVDALVHLGIDVRVVCSLNGQVESDLATPLRNGDEVRVFRPAGGGMSG